MWNFIFNYNIIKFFVSYFELFIITFNVEKSKGKDEKIIIYIYLKNGILKNPNNYHIFYSSGKLSSSVSYNTFTLF